MGLELLEEEIRTHRPNIQRPNFENPFGRSHMSAPSHHKHSTVDGQKLKIWHDITQDIQENAASAVSILDDLVSCIDSSSG